jgi:PAN domain
MSGFAFSSRLPLIGALMGAIAAAPTENGMDRPGGVYSYIPTDDAAACAIACAQDKICLAWSFKATEFVGCALKAIVPPLSADSQIESGIAPRASEFLALTSLSRPAPAESKPAPMTPPEKPRPVAELPAQTEAAFEPIVSPAFAATKLTAAPPVSASAPSLVQVSLSDPALIEEEFAGASPESILRTARLTAPQAIAVSAPAPMLRIAIAAPVLILEEEFAGAAPESFLHAATLASSPAAPTLRDLPALKPISLAQRDFVFEEEFEGAAPLEHFTLAAAPSRAKVDVPPALVDPWLMAAIVHTEAEEPVAPQQVLAQVAIVPRPLVFAISAEPVVQMSQAAPNAQTAALEEDLLGGPDNP